MGRAPCCEKMGLKKGPWTPEEDQILVNYIKLYGHGNWRALPKQAGLLRCGKSCRLRWTNYLRPDIKRGNFTREEEDTIINLHQMLGNRWSAIAARLPGRTDNEIKNVWHTHLKKRLKQNHDINAHAPKPKDMMMMIKKEEQEPVTVVVSSTADDQGPESSSSSEASTVTTSETTNVKTETETSTNEEDLSEIDENFWSEVLSADNSTMALAMVGSDSDSDPLPLPITTSLQPPVVVNHDLYDNNNDISHDANCMDFWYNLFTRAGDLPELPLI